MDSHDALTDVTENRSLSPEHAPSRKTPPIKPRRSIKLRGAGPPQQGASELRGAGQPQQTANGHKDQGVIKKMCPSLTLGAPGPLEPQSAILRAQTLLWFERSQLPRLRHPGEPLPCWLHGFTTRREAEDMLKVKPQGCFLLRLSESKIGFVLSYRGRDRCRHFIIEEEVATGNYLIAGEDSRHGNLQALIAHYRHHPVGPFDETLAEPYSHQSGGIAEELDDKAGGSVTHSCEQNERTLLSPDKHVVPETVLQIPATPVQDSSPVPEYAVVKKLLKKSCSIPENHVGDATAPDKPEEVIPVNHGPAEASDRGCGADAEYARVNKEVIPVNHGPSEASDRGCGADAEYARVNKPPRTRPDDTSPYVNVARQPVPQQDVMSEPQTEGCDLLQRPGGQGANGETGSCWAMEPPHTYEETPLLAVRDQGSAGQIGFYAMGRWTDVHANTPASQQHHEYSEVNIRGVPLLSSSSSSGRVAPPSLTSSGRVAPPSLPSSGRVAPPSLPSAGRVAPPSLPSGRVAPPSLTSSGRVAPPSLPFRPPPARGSTCPPALHASTAEVSDDVSPSPSPQHRGLHPALPQRPLTSDPGSSIYESIPERLSGPPLPPPNPKLPPPNAKRIA